jgi:Holliday junction resolvase RusA-like endonuclease
VEAVKIAFTILGEPASKSNSRIPRIVKSKKTGEPYTMFIKSVKANHYERDALKQIPPDARQMLEGPVRVTLRIFYASERPDLDESVVLDVLQAKFFKNDAGIKQCTRRGVYINDRQVREKHVHHFIDRNNPRSEIEVEPLVPQQVQMEVDVQQVKELLKEMPCVPF